MADNAVEKKLLYLVVCSLVLHLAVFVLLLYLPAGEGPKPAAPMMVDLADLPEVVSPPRPAPPVERKADEFKRVPREMAPRGEGLRNIPSSPPSPPVSAPRPSASPPAAQPGAPAERSAREELFRRKEPGGRSEPVNIYPSATRLAKIEERYRQQYSADVAEGSARFLNTDDIQFGSFLRRFENAVYGVWRYPQEAVRMGIEGVTPVRITFNRRGEVVGKEILQSSGSKILDDEVLRTLGQVGPVGSFPRGYDKDTFVLIAFFHYGITQGVQRSLR